MAPKRFRATLIVAVLTLAALAWIWLWSGQIRQMQVIFTYAVVLFVGAWALGRFFRSDRPRGLKTTTVTVLLAIVLAFAATVRVRGVTGDWLPVLEWRFGGSTDWSERTGSLVRRLDPEPAAGPVDLSFPSSYARFLGPDQDSTVRGLTLGRNWQGRPPREIWRRPVGEGWAGFAIVDGLAYTLEQRDDFEVVVAYDLATGGEIWLHSYEAHFSSSMAGPGPRTTPSVSQSHVFAVGATGMLHALERRSGRLVWRRDVVGENEARLPEHGSSGSPLLVNDLVVVSAGGHSGRSLVAYDQATGEPVWSAGDDGASFSSPIVARLGGVRQIVVFNASTVAGHDPEDGRLLWQHPWPASYPNVAPPLVVDGERVVFSTGYGVGAKMLRVRPAGGGGNLSAELVWESPFLKAKFTNMVVHEGSIYALDDGILVCLDPETGERRWKRGRYGHGNLLLVDDVLLLQTEKGEMVLIDPHPEELRELDRFMALPGKAWNHFALVDPYLLVRNDREAALWELPVAR